MKNPSKGIETLISDIYALLDYDNKVPLLDSALDKFAEDAGYALNRAVASPERGPRPPRTLYASDLRDVEVCPRKVWYKVFQPESAEYLMPHNRIKFLYGDLTESMLVFLAEQAGHHVERLQESVEYIDTSLDITVRGRIDCVIDDVLVDVKSAASPSFKRMTSDQYDFDTDMFSYHRQLQFYDWNMEPPTENGPDGEPKLLIMDKQMGTLALKSVPSSHAQVGNELDEIMYVGSLIYSDTASPPDFREWSKLPHVLGEEDTTHGNKKLKTYCSYCAFKSKCWADQGKPLSGYLYSYGPVWMTEVNKVPPKVPAIA